MPDEAKTEQWAVVELLGHVKLAGRLTEEERFGAKMGRLDIPQGEGFVTQHFGGNSVYRITYVGEAEARMIAARNQPAPISPWELPKQLTAVGGTTDTPRVQEFSQDDDDLDDADDIRF